MGARTAYDAETRRKAIELALEMGPENAAAELGIKPGTVRSWLSTYRIGKATMSPLVRTRDLMGTSIDGRPIVPPAGEGPWEDRKERLSEKTGAVAEQAIATAERLLTEGRPADALSAMRVSDYATKQAQLLTGGATDRRETRTLSLTASLGRLAQILMPSETLSVSLSQTNGLPIPAEVVSDQPKRSDDHSPSHQTGAIPADG